MQLSKNYPFYKLLKASTCLNSKIKNMYVNLKTQDQKFHRDDIFFVQ